MRSFILFLTVALLTACSESKRTSRANPFSESASAPVVKDSAATSASTTTVVPKMNLDYPEQDALAAFNNGDRRFYRIRDPLDNIWGVPSYTQAVGPLRVNGLGYEYATKVFDDHLENEQLFVVYRRYAVLYNDAMMQVLERHDRRGNANASGSNGEKQSNILSNPRADNVPINYQTEYPEYMFPALSHD